jgi:crotonobetaine/carnitine-CoA ligase
MRAGATYVPCSTHYTPDELEYQLGHAGVRCVFTDPAAIAVVDTARRACPRVEQVIVVGGEPTPGNRSFDDFCVTRPAPHVALTADDLAMVIYTSGTTDRPKGVALSHGNLVTATHNVATTFGYTPDDRVLHFFPMFHINGGVVTLFPALTTGATVVIVPRFSSSAFGRQLAELDITYCSINATNVKLLLNTPPTPFDGTHRCRRMLLGLSLENELRREFEDRFATRLCGTYGFTEIGVVTAESPSGVARPGSAGRILRGYVASIVDDDGGEVARGATGELLLASTQRHGLAQGYLHDDEKTREAFRDGWFHTGDVGYIDDDGYFWFVERKKDIIKRAGFNVAPAEVERVIRELPGVLEVAVVGVPDRFREEAVVAYIVAERSAMLAEDDVLAACRAKLASYKVPQLVQFIDEMPVNFLGKIERRRLRERALLLTDQ